MSTIVDSVDVYRHSIEVKLALVPHVGTLTADNFKFYSQDATPKLYPFEQVVLSDDYNSIHRVLVLTFDGDIPDASGDYDLIISNVKSASGFALPSETLVVPYDFDNEPVEDKVDPTPVLPVEDKSIKADIFTEDDNIFAATPDFYIIGSDPNNGDAFLEAAHNNGRLSFTFSSRPNLTFVNSDYIKVHRKDISSLVFSRWEEVATEISLHSTLPIVYVDLPSTDATPVYYEPGSDYIEDGYKYRVRFSAAFAPQVG